MSAVGASQLAFAAEFATFLVAVAGLACALRPGLLSDAPWARSASASGFLGLATAAFLRGALVVTEPDEPFLVGLRLLAGVALLVGVVRWTDRRSALSVVVGLVALASAGIALRADEVSTGDGLRAVAALAFAVGLIWAARRSISARIAVDAAGLVLGVVLVVAVAVSVTVSDNVDGQAEERYAARAAGEADAVAERAASGLGPARVVAGVLAAERSDVLVRTAAAEAPTEADAVIVAAALADLTADRLLDLSDPVVFITASGNPLAAAPSAVSPSTRLAVAGDPVVVEARTAEAERQGVTVVGDQAYALAAAPVVVAQADRPQRFVGVVVVARPLDGPYLQRLGTAGEDLSFALVAPGAVVARTAGGPSASALRAMAAEVVDEGGRPRRRDGSRFVAAVPVDGSDGRAVLAFVVAAPADAAEATQQALFRTLFVVALGSALVAVVVAVAVGERIGRGLRQLTSAAEAMQSGALDARIRVRSDDELGVLGGAFSTMASSIRVMTDELRASALEEAAVRARLEAVVSGMSEALLAIDRAGEVIELNRAAEELLGAARADVLGRPVEEVVAWRLADGRSVPLARTDLVDGEALAADLARGEHTIPVVVTSGTLRTGDGAGDGAVIVLRDIRREREVEDLKSSILANIGHELRTPLTPIKGYAGMLRDRDLSRDQTRTFAAEIIGGVDQLERVVRQLVTFATIAAGHLDARPEPTDVPALAESLRARWAPRVDDRHTFEVVVADDVEEAVVDATLFVQAIDELVDNAFKYSPEGGAVTVTFAPGTRDWPGLAVTVTDEGVGMPMDQMAGLAEAFTQVDASETRRFGGLGLGLACADRIVRAHGGRLAYAAPGHGGTRVSILLPMGSMAGDPLSTPPGDSR